MRIQFSARVRQSVDVIRERFDESLFTALMPAWVPSKLVRFDGCAPRDEVHLVVGPLHQDWVSVITKETQTPSGWSFVDEGKLLPWPFRSWHHHHRVDRISEDESLIVDDITYQCKPGLLSIFAWPVLWLVFSSRPASYQRYFSRDNS
ncbi:MAG TPA: hypothetical protein VNJ01_07905 [Bacteriovoracaceae bacterium]|nr:hypothetical protein [Bacteriovoracaceae bacterium]